MLNNFIVLFTLAAICLPINIHSTRCGTTKKSSQAGYANSKTKYPSYSDYYGSKYSSYSSYPKYSKYSQGGFRIVGGSAASAEEFPWQVSLDLYGDHFCGGSIINNKCILTAAHCLDEYRSNSYRVNAVVGTLVRTAHSHGTRHKVVRKIFHPKWNRKTSYADLMVLCVQPHIKYRESHRTDMSSISPICLPRHNFAYSGKGKISGFGKTSNYDEPSTRLYYINTQILSQKKCQALFGDSNFPFDQKTMICAGKVKGSGTCNGDSGGPLVVFKNNYWYQYGVVSYGGDVCGESPTVYTKVSAFSSWITRACSSCH